MSAKRWRREAACVNFSADIQTRNEAMASGDVLALSSVLNRISHRINSDVEYREWAMDRCTFDHQGLLNTLEEIQPQVQAIQMEQAWAKLPVKIQVSADEAKAGAAKLAAKITEAIEKNWDLVSVFKWSEKSFEAAADADVYAQLVAWVEQINEKMPEAPAAERFEKLHSFLNDRVRSTGRYRECSTSVTSNLSKDCLRVAWAKIPEFMIWLQF